MIKMPIAIFLYSISLIKQTGNLKGRKSIVPLCSEGWVRAHALQPHFHPCGVLPSNYCGLKLTCSLRRGQMLWTTASSIRSGNFLVKLSEVA